MPRRLSASGSGYEELRGGKEEVDIHGAHTHTHMRPRDENEHEHEDGNGNGNGNEHHPIITRETIPPGSTKETWYPNTTFSMKPTPESEEAWGSLMPVGRGFIYRPEIAPIVKSVSHGLRTSYYDLHYQIARAAGAPPDPYLEQKSAHTHIETAHQKHCFDYLRRAIMCAADTNLEYVDPVTDDTTGWGSERVCRSFEDVKGWAEKWANGTGEGIA
ncbi:hypothetical protein SBOR_5981 [Sclerotinia borealis F-4128]|uniref:Tat pathway signal sequence n=1 Tax=Sclerotinia borealis (strain F-4128) TaxID=1432307 RepID=W9CA42_SCLBF|nr:hypothetical protein SBOR_5981 [Sclerotinia borealis F-4128]